MRLSQTLGRDQATVEEGVTPGGIPVRNVAQPVLDRPVAVYDLEPGRVVRAA